MSKFKKKEFELGCDVIVVGGGFPGVCAAVAASRAGADTILVERDELLGGQSAFVDTWGVDAFFNEDGEHVIGGIPWEILLRTLKEGQSDPFWDKLNLDVMEKESVPTALRDMGLELLVPHVKAGLGPLNDQYVNPNAYRFVCHQILEEAGVTVLLGTPVVDVELEGSKIKGVVAQAEFQKVFLRGKVVVDTTQQALVGALAGRMMTYTTAYMGTHPRVAGVDMGALVEFIADSGYEWNLHCIGDGKAEKGITVDMIRRLSETLPGTALFIRGNGFQDRLAEILPEAPEFEALAKLPSPMNYMHERDGTGVYFFRVRNQINTTDPFSVSHAINDGRKWQWLVHKFFRNHIPGFEKAHLVDVHPHIAKAYKQSMEPGGYTEYDISAEEIESGTTDRDDVILRILGHPRSGQCPTGWYLPYASLIPKGLDGILVTGKPACGKIHYQGTCALVGQGAGVAAAISVKTGKCLRDHNVEAVRRELFRQDARILFPAGCFA